MLLGFREFMVCSDRRRQYTITEYMYIGQDIVDSNKWQLCYEIFSYFPLCDNILK